MIIVTAKLGNQTETINAENSKTNRIKFTINQETGAAIDSLQFTIYSNNAGYDLIASRKTKIKAINTKTGRVEFNGSVLLATPEMNADGVCFKTVTCQSLLGYLCDTVQPWAEEQTMLRDDYIQLVLNNHNAQCENDKKIFLGSVDVPVAGTGNVTKGLQYQTTYETLKAKLVDIYGGDLQVIEDANGVYRLNWLQEIGETRATEIKLGKNMQDARRTADPLDIITRIIPLGAKIKRTETDADGNETEVETEERLTLTGYTPPGKPTFTNPWVDDTDKIAVLGIISGKLDFSDVTEQSNLYSKTLEYMQKQNLALLSHSITALDLSEIGVDIDSLNRGDKYPVKNEKLGINDILRITKKTINSDSLYKSSLTFGDKSVSLSSLQARNNRNQQATIEQLQKQIQSLQNVQAHTNTQVITLGGSVTETVEAYVSERFRDVVTVSDLNELEERTSFKITSTADGLNLDFSNQIKDVQADINGNVSTRFENLRSYIDFGQNAEGKPYIILLKDNAEYSHEITNEGDLIKENGVVSSGFSRSQSFADNGVFNKSVAIGDYIWRILADGTLAL
ncbi:MAG: phage tail protein [Clostridia bacterium]|nr:phage tail protein [Clostridia bacterium]